MCGPGRIRDHAGLIQAAARPLDGQSPRPRRLETAGCRGTLERDPCEVDGERLMPRDRLVNLRDRGLAHRHVRARLIATLDRCGPLPRGSPSRGEVLPELDLDAVDEQRLGTRERHLPAARGVQCAGQRVASGQVDRARSTPVWSTRCACQRATSTVSARIAADPFVRLVPRPLAHGCGAVTVSSVTGRLWKRLKYGEPVRARGYLGGDLGTLVDVRRLDLLDFLLGSSGP